jgi:hypothetical protein
MQPKHSNSALSTQELNWHGTDTEELYQKNLIDNSAQLELYNWVDQPITYKFNHYGFRADEFATPDSGIMFLGCSHTLGVGLPIESTWTHLVSTALKLKNFNLGVGGASNDTAFRLANYWINQLRPKIVIFLSTEQTRTELHTIDGQIVDLSIWPQYFKDADKFMRHWHGNDINCDMNYLKNALAIKQLCSEYGIKYLQQSAVDIHKLDQARDLQHFGARTHRRISTMFLSKL